MCPLSKALTRRRGNVLIPHLFPSDRGRETCYGEDCKAQKPPEGVLRKVGTLLWEGEEDLHIVSWFEGVHAPLDQSKAC